MTISISLTVNGSPATVVADDPDMPLLYALRNDLGLHGPRFGCGLGQCGACTVLIGRDAVRSCSVPVGSLSGQSVITLEGLGSPEKPAPIQAAFIAEQAMQCGYCSNGMIMQAHALLMATPEPTDEQIVQTLANNLCRCGSHGRVVRAVRRAAGRS